MTDLGELHYLAGLFLAVNIWQKFENGKDGLLKSTSVDTRTKLHGKSGAAFDDPREISMVRRAMVFKSTSRLRFHLSRSPMLTRPAASTPALHVWVVYVSYLGDNLISWLAEYVFMSKCRCCTSHCCQNMLASCTPSQTQSSSDERHSSFCNNECGLLVDASCTFNIASTLK